MGLLRLTSASHATAARGDSRDCHDRNAVQRALSSAIVTYPSVLGAVAQFHSGSNLVGHDDNSSPQGARRK